MVSVDVEIMVYPSILVARNYLSLQKLFGKTSMVCQINFGTWHLDPQEGSMLQTRNLGLRLESPIILRMVTHQPKDGHPPEEIALHLKFGTKTN